MSKGFSVTFERFLPHDDDEDICEADEIGFVVENVNLRDALLHVADLPYYARATEADEWPIQSPRWFRFDDWNNGTHEYFQGITEVRSLHVPEHITPASRRRLARFLGLKTE